LTVYLSPELFRNAVSFDFDHDASLVAQPG
jgi:hypothetical protein